MYHVLIYAKASWKMAHTQLEMFITHEHVRASGSLTIIQDLGNSGISDISDNFSDNSGNPIFPIILTLKIIPIFR